MAWSLIDCVGTARTPREKVSLMNWARRGLPALVFIASALFASPAHAESPASISIDFTIDAENCVVSAVMKWSDQPGSVREAHLDFCEENEGCFGYAAFLSPPDNRFGQLSTPQVQLFQSSEHHWYVVGSLYSKSKVVASQSTEPVPANCSRDE